jgi:hypothetical protein
LCSIWALRASRSVRRWHISSRRCCPTVFLCPDGWLGGPDMKCSVCENPRELCFSAEVLKKYRANYFHCRNCGLLQAESPSWLDEAYSAPIARSDTGLVQRNLDLARALACLLYACFGRNGKYLDIAGGYGLLTRLMRDCGFDYYWHDKYCENLFARGFEVTSAAPPFSAVTAFEVLEHLQDPLEFLRDSVRESGTRTIIFSTVLYEGNPPAPEEWWYYAFDTGQHISFYQGRTLAMLAGRMGLRLHSKGSFHMLTDRRINPGIFGLLVGRLSHILVRYVRSRMNSRIFSDHEKLTHRG